MTRVLHPNRPRAPARTKHLAYALAPVVAVLTLLALGGACANQFLNFDDPEYVTGNGYVRSGLSGENTLWALTTTEVYNWHPLTWLSLQVDCELYGPSAFGFHLSALLIHVANAVLLFLFLNRWTNAPWRSFLVAGLFALHPQHVESVAWVAERKDVLSAFFGLLALHAYGRYALWPSPGRYAAVLAACSLSLLAKPMLVTLPVLLLLLDFWPLGRLTANDRTLSRTARSQPQRVTTRRALLEKLPLLILCSASAAVTIWAQQTGGAMRSLSEYTITARIENALVTYIVYLVRTVWPRHLTVFYPHSRDSFPAWEPIVAFLILAAATASSIRTRRRSRYIIVGWLWYLISLLPVIGLIQVGPQASADRYTYVPLVGIFIVMVWVLGDELQRLRMPRWVGAAIGTIWLGICAAGAWQQNRYWHDSLALWEHAVASTDGNKLAEKNLAATHANLRRYGEAMKHYRKAIEIDPEFGEAHHYLGVLLGMQGDNTGAAREFAAAAASNEQFPPAHFELGMVLARQGRTAEAVAQFRDAVRLLPGDWNAEYNLAVALDRLGDHAEARVHYERARKLQSSAGSSRR
jgi:Flp pilus assembly protein TadD